MRSAIISIASSRESSSQRVPYGRRYLTLYSRSGRTTGQEAISSRAFIRRERLLCGLEEKTYRNTIYWAVAKNGEDRLRGAGESGCDTSGCGLAARTPAVFSTYGGRSDGRRGR